MCTHTNMHMCTSKHIGELPISEMYSLDEGGGKVEIGNILDMSVNKFATLKTYVYTSSRRVCLTHLPC